MSCLRVRMLRGALATAAVGAVGLLATTTTALAASGACANRGVSTSGRFAGIVGAVNQQSGCLTAKDQQIDASSMAGDTASGNPPLIFHGGPVMGTSTTGPLVITPIFWNPAGYPMSSAYKSIITKYLSDVAEASGRKDNVFSIGTEYSGTDGTINYNVQLGTPINDTNPLPPSGCKLMPADTGHIYADGSGYSACIDDNQVIAETNSVVTKANLPENLSHIYVLYVPKHVESCFNAGATSTAKNACTLNYEPSAAYCAYHSEAGSMVYANMPFPIYGAGGTGYTCGSDSRHNFGVIESPNGNPDADTEVSPTSHEVIEAETDPDTQTGWYDSVGYEIGDECAYIYGTPSGTAGQLYNQVINRDHYLTQEEFSNQSFFMSGGGCIQGENQVRTGS